MVDQVEFQFGVVELQNCKPTLGDHFPMNENLIFTLFYFWSIIKKACFIM